MTRRIATYNDLWVIDRSEVADGCWEWSLKRNSAGYGVATVHCGGGRAKSWLAHRLSYCAFHGEMLPDGVVVMHSCDNPPCVNPSHLSVGTQSDNMRDMYSKGRKAVCEQAMGRIRAKLSDPEVQILLHGRACGYSYGRLSERHQLDRTSVGKICRGESYKWVDRGGRVTQEGC